MSLPTVTAVIAAHQAERFVEEALRSALGQDYPPALLDVVLVDDGCTDATPAIAVSVAAEHPGRVTIVRQANAGYVAATERGIHAANGELIALLDADDVWPADKTARQVRALASNPRAALLYGDMTVIDACGDVVQASWLEGEDPPCGRDWAALLHGNLATSSSILMRGELARALLPIPREIPFADWFFALRAMQTAEVVYLPEPRTLYRHHGANMSLGTQGAELAREFRKSAALQRWFLRRLPEEGADEAELVAVWATLRRFAREAALLDPSVDPLGPATERDRVAAEHERLRANALRARGEDSAALRAFLCAAATDPGNRHAVAGIGLATAAAA